MSCCGENRATCPNSNGRRHNRNPFEQRHDSLIHCSKLANKVVQWPCVGRAFSRSLSHLLSLWSCFATLRWPIALCVEDPQHGAYVAHIHRPLLVRSYVSNLCTDIGKPRDCDRRLRRYQCRMLVATRWSEIVSRVCPLGCHALFSQLFSPNQGLLFRYLKVQDSKRSDLT